MKKKTLLLVGAALIAAGLVIPAAVGNGECLLYCPFRVE